MRNSGEGYTIERQDNLYKVRDNNNSEIINFRSNPFGVTIEGKSNVSRQLQEELKSFRSALAQKQSPPPSLTPEHIQEAASLGGARAVAEGLIDFARHAGQDLEVNGNHYKWKASLDGDVEITRLSNKQVIFQQENGLVKSGMREGDIDFFNQVFASYQQQKQNSQSAEAAPEPSFTRTKHPTKSQMQL